MMNLPAQQETAFSLRPEWLYCKAGREFFSSYRDFICHSFVSALCLSTGESTMRDCSQKWPVPYCMMFSIRLERLQSLHFVKHSVRLQDTVWFSSISVHTLLIHRCTHWSFVCKHITRSFLFSLVIISF